MSPPTAPSTAPWVEFRNSTVGGSVTVRIDAGARRATAAVMAVRSDPTADAGFVGRDHELTQLLTLLAPHPDPGDNAATTDAQGSVVAVAAVGGAPGVGKTALAQAVARAAVRRDWFPGGAVSVDLHGYDLDSAAVVWPAQLYPGLLRAFGVPGEQVPPDESGQATAYHQLLDRFAQADQAVLLVFDNVSDTKQVAELLPRGMVGHRVLITSRDTLAALPDVRLLDLHVLEPAAAVQLLALGLRRRHPSDGRVAADPAAAARLIDLCGGLPLAVQIVAAMLADESDRPLAELGDELADEGHRLQGLAYDRRWAIRAAFDLSYGRLDPDTARLFALLAVAPGPDVGLEVAAVLSERTARQTRAGLRGLCRAHLLEQLPATPSGQGPQWRMHDLIRLYAAERLTPVQRASGFTRVLSYYRRTADWARRRFTPLAADEAKVPARFATAREAMAWVLAERPGLVACVTQAVDTHPEDAALLAIDLAPFLARARQLVDWVAVAAAAADAADPTTNPYLAAAVWNDYGLALREARRFEEAIIALELAREIYRTIGDRAGEGQAWGNLGGALLEVRRFEEAITALHLSRDIHREVGDRAGEGQAWGNLGNVFVDMRRFEEAITAHQQAGDIFREVGDRWAEGEAWGNLGLALRELRRFEEAITAHQKAREIYRETGDRLGEGQAWGNLGNTLLELRRFEEAITAHQQAGNIFREVGDRWAEGAAWSNLGLALLELRRFEEAITAHQQAREIGRETGNRLGEGMAWHNLGTVLTAVRRFDEAINAYERAIALCAEVNDRYGQASAYTGLGCVYAELDRPERMRRAWAAAVELYTAVGADDAAALIRQLISHLDR